MGDGIGLNRVHFPVTALGPGRRVGIWLQGCSIRCAGCMSLDSWAAPRSTEPVSELLERMAAWLSEADGVTISGGEPFDQPQALKALLSGLRGMQCGPVLVYSGYPLRQLVDEYPATLALIDVLISEPFEEAHSEPALLRGSSNQRVTCITARGVEMWKAAEVAGTAAPVINIVADEIGDLWLAGIPRPGDLARLSAALARGGLGGKTSAGRLGGAS